MRPAWQDEEWFAILARESRAKSREQIGRELGYARTSISLVMSGRYPVRPQRIADRVLEVYGAEVACPHLGRDIPRTACADMRAGPMPTSDPTQLRHWTACRTCPLNAGALKRKRKQKQKESTS